MDLHDIIYSSHIIKFLTVQDIAQLEQVEKKYQTDQLWKTYAIDHYTSLFWQKARKRNKMISKPLPTYKQEIKRMFEYEKISPMTTDDYYTLWKHLEPRFR